MRAEKSMALPVTVTQRVVDGIEAMIAEGSLAPGHHVSEPFIAERLEVSRGPVREACRALVERGLLIAEPNRGFFVRRLSEREVADLYDVRAALAGLAGRTLAPRITPEQQAELSAMVAAHEAAAADGDLVAMQAHNARFHSRIVALSGNLRLQAIEASMDKELTMYRRRAGSKAGAMPARNAEHRAILDALARQDAEAAGAALEQHMLNSKQRFLQTLD